MDGLSQRFTMALLNVGSCESHALVSLSVSPCILICLCSRWRTSKPRSQVAKRQAKRDPRVIISDGLDSYRGEYRSNGSEQVVHIAGVGIQSRINNNRVERLHNTMREREKVMRHLKRAQSAEKILKGFLAYYNFVRPHMTLDGYTRAQEAAIPIQLGTNRWLDLIRQAARNTWA